MKLLEALHSDELIVPAMALTSAPALYSFFRKRTETVRVKDALRRGVLSNNAIRRFIEVLMADLQKGVLFQHDRTLAALAVALEDVRTKWAETFFRELSTLNAAEIPFARRVAVEVLRFRYSQPKTFTIFHRGSTSRKTVLRTRCGGAPLPAGSNQTKRFALRNTAVSRKRVTVAYAQA